MDTAVNAADKLVLDVQELALKQRKLQTDYIKNENRVTAATEAALKAKTQADKANTELYQLNNGFKNVSGVLSEKTGTIGGAKDLALDLQRRANELAAQASNKLSFLSGKFYIIIGGSELKFLDWSKFCPCIFEINFLVKCTTSE